VGSQDQSTPERIRRAAAELIRQEGAGNLTLAAVAKTAGISKGGLLYHYPNKRALLQGLWVHLLSTREGVSAQLAGHKSSDDGANPANAAAVVNAVIDADFDLPADERVMAQALLAASSEDPTLLAPAKAHLSHLFSALAADPSETEAQSILLASQGLQLLEMLGLLTLAEADRQRIRQHLKSRVRAL